MMQKLLSIINKEKRRVIGIMSGTSMDGVDVALVEIEGHGTDTNFKLTKFITYPFPEEVRERVFRLFPPSVCPIEEICQINFVLGEVFACAVLDLLTKVGLKPCEVDLIGSHGQTICHLPDRRPRSTLQLGEPAVIAHRTGIVTVGDFRVADVSAGGQGAPLVPYVDFLLFRDSEKSRAIQNIGGISNVTVLPANCLLEDVSAFDTGPGNMMIDEIVKIITDGKQRYDRNGEMASKGIPNTRLLEKLLSHPFIHRPPPKTTGREDFGAHFARELLNIARLMGVSDTDLLATVTMLTAECIYQNYRQFILPKHDISEILVSGGGLHNLTLMRFLEDRFHPIRIRSVEDFGIPSDAKEALSFAILANETIHGNAGNIPSATGASRPVVLGKIVMP